MEEFLSTIWDYICHAFDWLLAWAIVLVVILGIFGMLLGFFRGDLNQGSQLEDILDELKKFNAKNKTKE